MMLSMLLVLLQAVPAPPAPPLADWNALPRFYETRPSRMTGDVTEEVIRLTRLRLSCRRSIHRVSTPSTRAGFPMVGIEVRLIVLVAPDGQLLEILTAPGPCEQIRNYARLIFDRYHRGLVRPPPGPAAAWYQSALIFSWQR